MDAEAQRIVSLPDMDDLLLARLAASNPTLLQIQLLRSTEAVRCFLDGSRFRETVASVPTSEDETNPISILYRVLAPRQPSFTWLIGDERGAFRCEYRVDDHIGIGFGATKRLAKSRAAGQLVQVLVQQNSDGI